LSVFLFFPLDFGTTGVIIGGLLHGETGDCRRVEEDDGMNGVGATYFE
jgi:hypothetical protein